MRVQDFYSQWLERCLKGKPAERLVNGNHAVRGLIYYYNNHPQQRLIKRKEGDYGLLMRHSLNMIVPKEWSKYFHKISVSDVGVFSRFDGDWLNDANTHERIRWLMLLEMAELVDEHVARLTGDEANKQSTLKTYEKSMARKYETYESYSRIFGLNWPAAPTSYRERMVAAIYEKKDRWNDPKSVQRRERMVAKRLAHKVLGLDD
jgi:hypothetical protein